MCGLFYKLTPEFPEMCLDLFHVKVYIDDTSYNEGDQMN